MVKFVKAPKSLEEPYVEEDFLADVFDVAECDDEANWPTRSPAQAEAEFIAEEGEGLTAADMRHLDDMSKLQDAEQKAFELTQPKLTPAEEQEIELIRYLGNEEADHGCFNSDNSSNLQGC